MLPGHRLVFQNYLQPGQRRAELPLAWLCLLFLRVPHLSARCTPRKTILSHRATSWQWCMWCVGVGWGEVGRGWGTEFENRT